MNFKFSLNETGSIGLIQKPASEILAGVESDIESLALSLDMSEADSEFGKAVVDFGIESTQYTFATEADAATAKKPGLLKRIKDQMAKTGGLKLYRISIRIPGSWVNKDKRIDCIAAFRNSSAFVACELFYKLIIDTIEYFEYLYTKRLTDNEIDNILANIFTSGEVDIEYVNKLKNEYIMPFKTLIKKFTTYFNINKIRYAQSSTSADYMYNGGDKREERDIEDAYPLRGINEKQ